MIFLFADRCRPQLFLLLALTLIFFIIVTSSRSNDCNKISTQHKNNSNSLSVESAEGEEDEKNIDVDGCAYSIF